MFSQDPFRNVFSVIFSFYLSMLIMKHRIFLREWISIVSFVFCYNFFLYPLNEIVRLVHKQIEYHFFRFL